MRSTTYWRLSLGLLSLCGLVSLPPSPRAEDTSLEHLEAEAFCLALPFRCRTGAAQATAAPQQPLEALPLPPVPPPPRLDPDQPAASAPPEDLLASDCRYVGFQTEWMASKRNAGLPLGAVLASARRVFAQDMPWHEGIMEAMGLLVYRDPQRAPAELRQAMEAACLDPSSGGTRWHAR